MTKAELILALQYYPDDATLTLAFHNSGKTVALLVHNDEHALGWPLAVPVVRT
jgi:hypothetical protein